ncbi:glycosyltransferase family 2 protein [Flectobacillus major]|uniref:glycosyltransferase family 2 protein n=1 Tax=Flectobacillus major TaxID=103 RepID=UPI000416FABD|nr:glycosyltransferase family 2 protein [Flectobacillus major]
MTLVKTHKITVIIPAYNEEQAVAKVIEAIPKNIVSQIIVVNNNSSDQTAEVAQKAGATVLTETQQGYGFACLKGINYVQEQNIQPDIIVFLDADYSDYPEELPLVIAPIIQNNKDLVIGSRTLGKKLKGSITPQQIFGNWLATRLIALLYGVKYTDLGPFRAIKYKKLLAMNMQDKTYGWTVEMQLKAAKQQLQTCEVPVSYKPRIGYSKVSGTLKGTILAGYKILSWIFKYL